MYKLNYISASFNRFNVHGVYFGRAESFLWPLLFFFLFFFCINESHSADSHLWSNCVNQFSPLCFSSRRRSLTQRWSSPSCRALYHRTPTPAYHQTTCSLRTSVPRMTPWCFTRRKISLLAAVVPTAAGGKPSASTLTPSWTSRCSLCTVRCRCAPRGCTTASACRRYATGFSLVLPFFFPFFHSFSWTSHQLSFLNKHVMWVWCLLKKFLPFENWLTVSF